MRYAVGYVSEISGQIVKRVFGGKDIELKQGDFIVLGDHVWSRSLDSYAKILLHGGGILEMKPGMRVAIDDEYLSANDIKDFYTQNEIDELLNQNNNFIEDSLLNTNITIYNKTPNDAILVSEENSQNIYRSSVGEVNIMVESASMNFVELYIVGSKTPIRKSQIQNNFVVFPIIDDKEYSRFDLYIKILDSSSQNEIFRYDFVIEIMQQNLEKTTNKEFDIKLERDYQDEISSLFEKVKFDLNKIPSIQGEQIPVDTKFLSNMKNPVFSFKLDHSITPKLFIMGFEDSIFEDRYELKSHIVYNEKGCFVISDVDFEDSGNYMFYVRYFNKVEGNALKEDFFSCDMVFKNLNLPIIDKIENNKIFGHCKENLEIQLYNVDDNVYTKIFTTNTDSNGQFSFDMVNLFGELFIVSVDKYKNLSKKVKIDSSN